MDSAVSGPAISFPSPITDAYYGKRGLRLHNRLLEVLAPNLCALVKTGSCSDQWSNAPNFPERDILSQYIPLVVLTHWSCKAGKGRWGLLWRIVVR